MRHLIALAYKTLLISSFSLSLEKLSWALNLKCSAEGVDTCLPKMKIMEEEVALVLGKKREEIVIEKRKKAQPIRHTLWKAQPAFYNHWAENLAHYILFIKFFK